MGNVAWIVCGLIVAVWIRSGVDLVVAGEYAPGALTLGYIASLVFIGLCTFKRGRSSAIAMASAVASARAEAESHATASAQNAVVVNVVGGAREVATRELGGLDTVSWRGDPVPLIEQDSIDDVSEDVLAEIRERTIEST